MDNQKQLRVFYSDISALRDRSDQPQLWEFLCCARQQKIKQCKNEDDRLRAFGAGLLLEYGLRQYGYTQTYLWDRLLQQSWSRPDKHGLCSR